MLHWLHSPPLSLSVTEKTCLVVLERIFFDLVNPFWHVLRSCYSEFDVRCPAGPEKMYHLSNVDYRFEQYGLKIVLRNIRLEDPKQRPEHSVGVLRSGVLTVLHSC